MKANPSLRHLSVGAPWEIFRAPNLNRTSWLYTKAGNLGLYSSEIILMPDYNVGFTVLAAGQLSHNNVRILSDMLAAIFVPGLKAAAKEEAEQVYAGTYTGPIGTNSSMTVVTDDNPGLGITQWNLNGTDVFPLIGTIYGATPDQLAQLQVSVRLYPTGLQSADGTKVAWRAVYGLFPEQLDPGAFSENCISWMKVDSVIYRGLGADEFLFNLETNADGSKAVSIEPRVLRTQLQKAGGTSGVGKLARKGFQA